MCRKIGKKSRYGRITRTVISSLSQLLFIGVFCAHAYAILPRSQAQIQAFRTDPQQATPPTDIGNVLDFTAKGATASQNLFPLNGIFHSSATTQVSDTLKLMTTLSQRTESDITPTDGLSGTTYYSLTAAAEFRDNLNISLDSEVDGEVTVILSFKLSGGPLGAFTDHAGASSVMSGEMRISLNDVAQVSQTGGTSNGLGVFDGADHTFDVSFTTELDDNVVIVKQLNLLLQTSGTISTFYSASNSANSGFTLELVDAIVVNRGEVVTKANIIGDTGFVYAGESSTLGGHYTAKDRKNHISFEADVESDGVESGSANYKLNVDGAKVTGIANITGVGPVTFGDTLAKSIQIKKKNKPTRTFSMNLKKKGDNYQLIGKVKQKGKPGAIQFTAKEK